MMNTQPTGAPQPKPNLWWVWILIIVVAAAIGGGIYYFKSYLPNQATATTSAPATATPSADEPMDPGLGTMPDVVTEGWQTYTNDEFGYSFKYPPFLTPTILQGGGGVALGAQDPKMIVHANAVKNETGDTLAEYVKAYQINLFKGVNNPTVETASKTTLGGQPAEARLWKYAKGGALTADRFIAASKGNNVYVIEMMVPYEQYSERKDYFERMVKSYEFK